MALQRQESKFDLKRICEKFSISASTIENSKITEDELKKIYNDFVSNYGVLEKVAGDLLAELNKHLIGKVHSIRARVKDPDHLIEKVIRNVSENPRKYLDISVADYNKIITDLIGLRIIILDKRDWKDVHETLLKIFRNDPERYAVAPKDIVINFDKYPAPDDEREWFKESYHAERPEVYISSEDDRKLYQDPNLHVNETKRHYRSIHYIIRYGNYYFEIQVRTLFEEGWLEFDHRVKYPYDKDNLRKQEYADILSSLAVAADRLISFYNEDNFKTSKKRNTKKAGQTQNAAAGSNNQQTYRDKIRLKF